MNDLETRAQPPESAWTVANVVYALHGFAIVVGIVGSATVVGSFVGSLPSIAAVVLNYLQRSKARGTWLDSHYRWQIRTFWYTLLWFAVGAILMASVIGIPLAVPIFVAVTLWVVYRIFRGWIRLRGERPMYQ